MDNMEKLLFPDDWLQTIRAHYGTGKEHQILVPAQLQLNKGMMLPDQIKDQDAFLPNLRLTPPEDLIGFNYARAYYNKGVITPFCVHFFMHDKAFQGLCFHQVTYTAMMKDCNMIISPDFSVYMNWTEHDRRQSAWRNQQFARLWQLNGIPVIFNVSWAGPDSYGYCIHVYPKHSVIAINCTGIKSDPDVCYFWHLGYEEVLKSLEPSLIIRYGDKMEGENEDISIYFDNKTLKRLHYGR